MVLGLSSGSNGWIAVLDDEAHGYQLLRWLRVEWPGYTGVKGAVFPGVGDLDGDGYAEIVAGLGRRSDGFVEIFGGANRNYAHQRWLQGQLQQLAYAERRDPSCGRRSQRRRARRRSSSASAPAVTATCRSGRSARASPRGSGCACPGPITTCWRAAKPGRRSARPGLSGPAVVIGLGNCSSVPAGWIAIVETAATGRPVLWRNGSDADFQRSGSGTFPAVIPR